MKKKVYGLTRWLALTLASSLICTLVPNLDTLAAPGTNAEAGAAVEGASDEPWIASPYVNEKGEVVEGLENSVNGKRHWLETDESLPVTVTENEGSITIGNGIIERRFQVPKEDGTEFYTDSYKNLYIDKEMMDGEEALPEVYLGLYDKPYREVYSDEGIKIHRDSIASADNTIDIPDSCIKVDPDYFYVGGSQNSNTFVFDGYTVSDSCEKPFEWTSNKIYGDPASKEWPPKGKHLEFLFSAPESFPQAYQGIKIKIIYEMYDNIPAMKKRVEIVNEGDSQIMIGRLAPEVIKGNQNMDDLLALETTYTCGDQSTLPINRPLPCKCDLEKEGSPFLQLKDITHTCYEVGPAYELEKGESMVGFDTYEFVHSTYWFELKMRERLGIYRTLFPWITDNPLTHHNTGRLTKEVIDQAAEAEFEMIIQSYSAPDESKQMLARDQATLDKYKELVDYAHTKGIAIGIYQAQYTRGQYAQSKEYGTNAEGQWGASMCLASAAFDDYWDNFKNFVKYTGMDCVEIDGTYPGNYCNCGEQHVNRDKETDPANPEDTVTGKASKYKFHNGVFDSQVKQWENGVRMMCAEFRDMGVFVKVPAWYYLNGANKCGIGYEEAAWSQPRQEQLLYGRQLMHNASYGRTMSMSWSHVPFAEYHGGGGDAAFQPFKEKKEDYNWVIAQNIGNGVNSDFRGPALFDDGTQDILNKWVEFYKRYRGIVNSDMVHISQAAYDAAGTNRQRGVKMDTLYHVNAMNEGEKGLLWVYNQTDEKRTEVINVPMYYTGLAEGLNYPPVPLKDSMGKDVHRYGAYPPNYSWLPQSEPNYRQPDAADGDYGQAVFMREGVQAKVLSIDSNGNAQLEVTLPPMSFTYYSIYDSAQAPNVSLEVGKVTGLAAKETTENSVVLNWDKDVSFKMTENGTVIDKPAVTVDSYMVYRDGELVAQTMENTYQDTSLAEQKNYAYTVKAVAKGVEGSLSEPLTVNTLTDNKAPVITKVEAKSDTSIEILFSEKVDAETAGNIGNYSISDGIQVKNVRVEGAKATLTTDALSRLQPYTLKVENICDASAAKNPMEAHEQKVIYGYIAKFGFEKAGEGLITDAFGNYTGKASYMETLEQTYGSSARLKEEKTSYGNLGSGLLKGLDSYSLSMWFKTDSEKRQTLLSQGQEGIKTDDLTLAVEAGSLDFHASDAEGKEVVLKGGTIQPGKWNLAVAARDGQTFTLYLNGEAVDTKTADIGVNDTQNAMFAGAMRNNAGGDRVNYFSGDISEVSLYNVALLQSEAALLNEAGFASFSAAADSALSLDKDLFTEESYSSLGAILAEIDSMDPESMMPSEIVDIKKRLQTAMDGLQLKDENQSLKALYHMNEAKGEVIANAVQGYDARFINGQYMRIGTPFGRGAYMYEKNQNYISVPDSPIAGLDTFTVNGWFKPQLFLDNEVTDTEDDFTHVRGTPKQVLLSDEGGNLVLSLQQRKLVLEISDGTQTQTLAAGEEFAMEQVTGGESRQAWNHFSVLRSGDNFALYLNGTKMGEVSLAGVTIGDSLTIGAKLNEENARELQYNGLVDEFAFYGSELTQEDITASAEAIPFRKSSRENIALKKTLNSDSMTDSGRLNDGKVLDYASKDTPWTARSNGTSEKLKYQIDLGAVYDIDTISLTQFFRNYNNEELRRFRDVVIQISVTSDFAPENTTTVLNTDTDNSMGCGTGTDQTFYSFELGNDFILDKPAAGRYVRLLSSGFYGLNGNYSGYVNVSELEVYGTKAASKPEIKVSAEEVELKVVGDREFIKVSTDADTNLADLIVKSGDEEIAAAVWSKADGLQINGTGKGNTDVTLTHPKDDTLAKVIHVTVDGMEPDAVVNDDDPAITYTGSFTYYNGRGGDPDGVTEYNRDIHYGNKTGDAAEYTFTGTGIDVITTVNTDGCLLGVTIDGEEQPDVNSLIPNEKYFKRANQMCVFSKTDLPYGEHTIRLENKGGNITVDALRTYADENRKVDKTALQQQLETAEAYIPDAYTEESFEILKAAIAEAKAVYENDFATQDDVDIQVGKLQEAIAQLESILADLTQLQSLYNAISKMDLSSYTEDSAAALNTAMEH
uniref:LamG-like jellyroll fold domain-containing protein n=1 Tax=uncultured Robinsoniella sp. TaxID=904190 RepID=UPI00374F4AF0